MTTDTLTVREHMALQLVSRRYKYPAARESASRHEVGYGETRLWQVVDALLERPAAESDYPTLVRRLRRLRDARSRVRAARLTHNDLT